MGMADVINSRLLKRMKKRPTYVNSITASTPAAIRVPVNFAQDRRCLDEFWPTVGKQDPMSLTMGWVRNSQDLSAMAFTENLRAELEANPQIELLGPARELEYDEQGNLVNWLEGGH
jgi:hypothetical protein